MNSQLIRKPRGVTEKKKNVDLKYTTTTNNNKTHTHYESANSPIFLTVFH